MPRPVAAITYWDIDVVAFSLRIRMERFSTPTPY